MIRELGSNYLKIGLIACCALYTELLLIRWISTEVSIFAYLQNSILIVCFLGLGMGLLFPSTDKSVMRSSVWGMIVLSALLSFEPSRVALGELSRILSSFHDFVVWQNAIAFESQLAQFAVIFSGVVALFLLLAVIWSVMLPLGRLLGGHLDLGQRRILAYSFDIGGSLLGIWIFSVLGFFSLAPTVWVAILALLLMFLVERKQWPLLVCLPLFCFISTLQVEGDISWTPYQKIRITPSASSSTEFFVETNNSSFQQIQDNALGKSFSVEEIDLSQYDIAARLHPRPKKVLLCGVGTGNDLAGAIRQTQTAQIIGVEIDPRIIDLGKRYHPEKPLGNSRVTIVEDDARASFHSLPRGEFDLVITGLLDSHTTPNLSNARLDNFVYTKEAIRAASRLLTEKGVFVLSFQPQRDYIYERLRLTLDEVFGGGTLVFNVPGSELGWGGVLFVNGSRQSIESVFEADPILKSFVESNTISFRGDIDVKATTDDWPYLYLKGPLIPVLFFILAGVLVFLWVFKSLQLSRQLGRKASLILPKLGDRESFHFFCLGVGFIALQVFAITKMSLLFGSTWIVNSVVISGMLFTILLANYLSTSFFRTIPSRFVAAALVLTCISFGALSFEPLLQGTFWQRIAVAVCISGIPSFLSGLLFAQALAQSRQVSEALGANLFGALIGSLLQSITFLFGIGSLAYLGAIAYLAALISLPKIVVSNLEQ